MPSPTIPTPRDCEARRLFHGRGGFVPEWNHLSIDAFPPVVLVTLYKNRPENEKILLQIVNRFTSDPLIETIVVQERYSPRAPKRQVLGALPETCVAVENGLRYQLTLDRNQNHGFFLDMQPGRDWTRANANGKRVLNLFAYTCSLSVAAIAGGAESVTNLDMASAALSTGRKNHQLNFDTETCHRASYLAHDLFKSWGKLKRLAPFDLIIIDPPSNQTGSFVAEKDYQKIARRLTDLTQAKSKILACLNAPHLNASFLTELLTDFKFQQRLPAAPGFEDKSPDATLKALVFEV